MTGSVGRLMAAGALSVVVGCGLGWAQERGLSSSDAEVLRARLASDQATERIRAVRDIGIFRFRDFSGVVLGILSDRNEPPALRDAAAGTALVLDGSRAMARLKAIAEDRREDPRAAEVLRIAAIRAIADRPDLGGIGLVIRLAIDRAVGEPVQTEAIQVLGFVAPHGLDEPFLLVARDSQASPRVRAAAVRHIGRRLNLGSWAWLPSKTFPEGAAVLVDLLNEETPEITAATLAALRSISREAVPRPVSNPAARLRRFYLGLLDRAATRADAVALMGRYADEKTSVFLIDVIQTDVNADVRIAALSALGEFAVLGEASAFQRLGDVTGAALLPGHIRLKAIDHWCTAGIATRRLDVLLKELPRRLGERSPSAEPDAAVRCLARLDVPEAATLLWSVIATERFSIPLREAAVRALENKNPDPKFLRLRASTGPPPLRAAAIDVLARTNAFLPAEALELLERQKPPEPVEIRSAAASALSTIRDLPNPGRLLNAFKAETDPRTRLALIRAMGRLRNYDHSALRLLLIGIIEDPRQNSESRQAAVAALYPNLLNVPAVGTLLADRSSVLRVLRVMTNAGEPADLRRALVWEFRRLLNSRILGDLSGPVGTALVEIARDSSEPTGLRTDAIRAVAALVEWKGDRTLVKDLGTLAESSTLAYELRKEAISAIGGANQSNEARRILSKISTDPDEDDQIRSAALVAFASTFSATGHYDEAREAVLAIARNTDPARAALRETAVFLLRVFASESVVLDELKDAALDIKRQEGIRAAAVAALSMSRNAGIESLVEQIAEKDHSLLVRWAARANR